MSVSTNSTRRATMPRLRAWLLAFVRSCPIDTQRRRRQGQSEDGNTAREASAPAPSRRNLPLRRRKKPRPSRRSRAPAQARRLGREQAGQACQLHAGCRTDHGRKLHRLPQPAQVGKQVRHDDIRPARQGGPARRGDHARAGATRREPLRRVDAARRQAADAVQARPAAQGKDRDSSSAGSPKGPSTTATRPARTGRSCCARHSRSRSPRPIP